MTIRIAAIAAALALTTSAIAADRETVLSDIQLPVMINQGSVYVEATESMFLYSGDRVMVLEGGSAQLNYANGCVQVLGANEVAQVDSTGTTCSSMAAAGTHQALGSSGTSGGGSAGLSTSDWVAVGIFGAGGIYVAERASSGSGSSTDSARPPASP